MNVVTPARASVTRSVPRSAKRKYPASPPSELIGRGTEASASTGSLPSSSGPIDSGHDLVPRSRARPTTRRVHSPRRWIPRCSISLGGPQALELHLDVAGGVERELAQIGRAHV